MFRTSSIARLVTLFAIAALVGSSVSASVVQQYDYNSGTEGFTGNNITGLTASGGVITGVASGNDPQLILGSAQLPGGLTPPTGSTWTTFEYRVRETNSSGGGFVSFTNASNTAGLAFTSNLGPITGSAFSFVDAGGGFTDVTVDISSYGSSTITNFRFDPIGGPSGPETNGNTFEVDFARFSATAVPEPNSLALLCFVGIGAAFPRKRTPQS